MNFVSKFDGSLPFTGTHPKAQTHVETVQTKAPSDAIVVKDANLLFNGDFRRAGTDLVISKDDHELVLSDYFKGDKRAPIASPDGAWLSGKIVDALTGHVQVAQADGSASAAKIIGHVTKLSGNATVVRNGVSIILNNGDNVYQGDVVQSGSNSTVGITFIDGSVFGLASNAKMVLNEMVYDPNGSSNSSLLSLVQGTISFVAGATAKHGDMKVDTPVATMGIRGTAVLVEIDFVVTVPGSAPPARFQVLVEPDGTSGSILLLDRVTLAPLATVNQPGTVTTVSGQGTVSFLASAQLSPELMKLISEVFSLRFTDSSPKSNTHFTDSVVPEITFPVKFAGGETGTATLRIVTVQEGSTGPSGTPPATKDHIPGSPGIVTFNKELAERTALTGSSLVDTTSGGVSYSDPNLGDVPTVSTTFLGFGYKNATGQDVKDTLTATQLSAIAAVSVPLVVVQDANGKNNGTATWTYNVEDHSLDFLAAGEMLTLTYVARVDNNFAQNNEISFASFTITITGTNDVPTIVVNLTTASDGVVEDAALKTFPDLRKAPARASPTSERLRSMRSAKFRRMPTPRARWAGPSRSTTTAPSCSRWR
ncbi:FecR domain-containing protein [Bradyrhizobium sp.]|uniref:FecR domain-containing protein n=1 Tax=Bradyrhizobium sp. TaxID=376 RepID=UPI001D2146BF|nr:FecR domain-containing protein [Bradyrhizobium sp.]MBI5321708.1 FecR domain-containing protein [Bradyrhizobium sp.]